MWEHFSSLQRQLPYSMPPVGKQRYSVTSDILAYQQCSIQYGTFTARNYEPALTVQLFYGTIIHQALDRAHAHFEGKLNVPQGTFPNDDDIERYFLEIENSLKARQIRAVKNVRDQALRVLKRFNNLEGPDLYPRVVDTECRLKSDREDYILHGNVDVLARSIGSDEVEIWDYKGASKPSMNDAAYQRYRFQMQVYAELYKQNTGRTPAKAILYFLNELAPDPEPTTRPVNAVMEVDIDPNEVNVALQSFGRTVKDIESCKAARKWHDPLEPPSKETCDACDLRWSCDAATKLGRVYPLSYP